MIRRLMVMMGLLGFSVALLGGVICGNSFEHTMIRALQGMAIFSILGLALGWAASFIVREHRKKQYQQILGPLDEAQKSSNTDSENSSTLPVAQPIQS